MSGSDPIPLNADLRALGGGGLAHSLGIEVVELSTTRVVATMPVDSRTLQPFGILHGGASVALAETVASVGAAANIDRETHAAVGLDPVSVSFGAVPAGSGQSSSQTVTLSSLDGDPGTLSATIVGGSGGGVTFSAGPVANGSVVVTMTAAKGAAAGDHQATLRISRGGAEVAHAAVYAFIK